MWKPILVGAAALLVVTTAVAGSVPANATLQNESPLADAGLDQQVSEGATVLLDGTGSRDPDGDTLTYQWSIRTPSNRTVAPDCPDCARTSFEPEETGRYRVILTVTDEDGATSSDTLYVAVSPGAGPSVSISGPRSPTEGTEVTYDATLDAGAAPLDRVVWTVDGVDIATHSLSPDQRTDSATKLFPTAGTRTVTATVYDAEGRTDTSSIRVGVEADPSPPSNGNGTDSGTSGPGSENVTDPETGRSGPENGSDPGTGGSGPENGSTSETERSNLTTGHSTPGPGPSIANRTSPTVTGDAVVTGDEPLVGNYEVEFGVASDRVASVGWWTAAGRVGTGESVALTWDPGDHDVYAVVTYADGSTNTATFADGTTGVTADPRPDASLYSLERYGAIAGAASGSDGYGNLDEVRVEVEGETVVRAESTLRGRRVLGTGRQRTVRFSHSEFSPGEPYSVTVVAVDDRGQVNRTTTEVVPASEPEVVRSEFAGGPVDSYHERIDPERYVARHVLAIDLNGVDPEDVRVSFRGRDETVRAVTDGYGRSRTVEGDTLLVDSFWAAGSPGTYYVNANWSLRSRPSLDWTGSTKTSFRVTPSDPELRLDVTRDGTTGFRTENNGIVVDASDTFDPDGTNLSYLWKHGATPIRPDSATAKFSSYRDAAVVVEDEYNRSSKRDFDFLDYYVPSVSANEVLTDGPYRPNDTVELRVHTRAYHFSKVSYHRDFGLGIETPNPATEVVGWQQVRLNRTKYDDHIENRHQYVGTVEVRASELMGEQRPNVTVYNEGNERKRTRVTLPEVGVLVEERRYLTDVSVRNLTYTVEKPRVLERTVQTRADRDEYVENGYEVTAHVEKTEYVLEEKVQVQEAEYETTNKTFDTERVRDMFLESHSGWQSAGTVETERAGTREFTEWKTTTNRGLIQQWNDGDPGNGERTGETRRKVVDDAKYETHEQFEREYEKTKTVTKEDCSVKFGCETEKTTETVTKTETYWAASKRDPSHTSTGKTKEVEVESAEYETEYEVRYETDTTETVTRYLASDDRRTQAPRYEWQEASPSDDSAVVKRQLAQSDDRRVRNRTVETWRVAKRTGTVRFETTTPENESHVTRTRMVANATLVVESYNSKTERRTRDRSPWSGNRTVDGYRTRTEMIELLRSDETQRDQCANRMQCHQRDAGTES